MNTVTEKAVKFVLRAVGSSLKAVRLVFLSPVDLAASSILIFVGALSILVLALASPAIRTIWRRRARRIRTESPDRLLIIGYNTIKEAKKKGLTEDYNAWYNPGSVFKQVDVLIINTDETVRRKLTSEIYYRQLKKPYAPRKTIFRYTIFLFSLLCAGVIAAVIILSKRKQVMQVNGQNFVSLSAMTAKRLTGIPSVMFIEAYWDNILDHQNYLSSWLRTLLRRWYPIAYRAFEGYIGMPSFDPEFYRQAGMRREAIYSYGDTEYVIDAVCPYFFGVDAEELGEVAGATPIPAVINELPRPWVVSVARLHPEKLPEDTVRMARELKELGVFCSIIMVGGGDMKEELEALARDLNVSDRVHFVGALPREQAVALMGSGDCYFATYHGCALLEAVALASPVVAYDNDVHRLFITDPNIVRFTPERDPHAAAAAVGALLENPDEAKALGKMARAWALHRYTARTIAESWYRPFQAIYERRCSNTGERN